MKRLIEFFKDKKTISKVNEAIKQARNRRFRANTNQIFAKGHDEKMFFITEMERAEHDIKLLEKLL